MYVCVHVRVEISVYVSVFAEQDKNVVDVCNVKYFFFFFAFLYFPSQTNGCIFALVFA